MSDLIQSDASLEVPVESRDDLVRFFERGCRPREAWKVGTEYEKLGVRKETGRAVPFFGPNGIEALLRRVAARTGWEPREENGSVVALRGPRATITLEPGGQLEMSGEQCDTVHCAQDELQDHLDRILEAAADLDITFLGLGAHPVSTLDEIEWVPKRRYEIMAAYMPRVGTRGHAMMKQTATVQVNLDYSDSHDAMSKLRISHGIAPIVTAIFANSPILEGRPTGYCSTRQEIWAHTDADRSGLLPLIFSLDAGFEDYADWAIDVPMYFLQRDDRLIDVSGTTFREFLDHGIEGHRATLADWNLHLTTLFPEARIKTWIELRSADSQPPERLLALSALAKGILYDDDCRLGAWDLVKKWRFEERLEAMAEGRRNGLRGRAGRLPLADLARELVEIGRIGLVRQAARNARGEDESIHLAGLDRWLERGESPADELAREWSAGWKDEAARLASWAGFAEPVR